MIYNLNLIKQWFIDTGIIEATTIEKQFIKFVEEDGEVAEELTQKVIDKKALGGEIGDKIVVLTGMAMIEGLDVKYLDIEGYGDSPLETFVRMSVVNGKLAEAIAKGKDKEFILVDLAACIDGLCKAAGIDKNECARLAYQKISKRKGKVKNGIFIKKEDLK